MKEELRVHLEQQINENIAKGMSAEEARLSAVEPWTGSRRSNSSAALLEAEASCKISFRTCVTAFGNCALAQAFLPWQFCA